jgi:hypothetical protein
MYNATEITYKIEGRIKNIPFVATGHKIKEGLFQVSVSAEGQTSLAGQKEADNAFTALWWAIDQCRSLTLTRSAE